MNASDISEAITVMQEARQYIYDLKPADTKNFQITMRLSRTIGSLQGHLSLIPVEVEADK